MFFMTFLMFWMKGYARMLSIIMIRLTGFFSDVGFLLLFAIYLTADGGT